MIHRRNSSLAVVVGAIALASLVTSCHASRRARYDRDIRETQVTEKPSPSAGREVPDRPHGAIGGDEARVREFRVTAKKHEFVPSRFELTAGEPVKFTVRSEDDLHTFSVKEDRSAQFDLFSIDVPAKETRSLTFTPERPGTLYLYCKPHEKEGMTGEIVVRPTPTADSSGK
jgi:plastocyanin